MPDIAATIQTAIDRKRYLTVRYRDVNGDVTRRKIRPLELRVSSNGDRYVVAYCATRDDVRSFRLDRITAMRPTDTRSKFGQYVMKLRGGEVYITHLHDMVTVHVPRDVIPRGVLTYIASIPTWRERNVMLRSLYNHTLYPDY